MDSAPAVVAHRMNRPDDLPDEAFEQILLFLTFKEKVITRQVCKSWFQSVSALLRRQSSIMLFALEKRACKREGSGWLFETCGHFIDRGSNATFTYVTDDPKKSKILCRERRAAIRGFCDAVTFVMKHCDNIRVADLSCKWALRTMSPMGRVHPDSEEYHAQEADVLHAASNRFVSKFQHQLRCLHCPMLEVTTDHCFPCLVHLTCSGINRNIKNIFSQIAPKLTALEFGQTFPNNHSFRPHDDNPATTINIDHYHHLPKEMGSITLTGNTERCLRKHVFRALLRSPARDAIHTIKNADKNFLIRDGRGFPNLRSLQVLIIGRLDKANILFVSASRLQFLEVVWLDRFQQDLPSNTSFPALRSLIMYRFPFKLAMDMISRTTDNLSQLLVFVRDAHAEHVPKLMTELSKLKSLTYLSLIYGSNQETTHDKEQVEAAVMRLLRGGSRSTLKTLSIRLPSTVWSPGGCSNPVIWAEIDRMRDEESLTVAFLWY